MSQALPIARSALADEARKHDYAEAINGARRCAPAET
jgi:hypothetical protein